MARWFLDPTPRPHAPRLLMRRLVPEAEFIGARDLEFEGCATDPESVGPGDLFVATTGGDQAVATASVALACERGAAGVVVDRPMDGLTRPAAVVANPRAAHARLRHALMGDPSARLDVIAIVGGREATAVGLSLRSILAWDGREFGSIGARSWSDGLANRPIDPETSGPGPMAERLAAMARRGCSGAIVELSEAAIVAGEAEGMTFAGAIATSVRAASADGRDTLDARRRAYASVAKRVRPGGAVVVDEDDPDSEILGSVNLDAGRASIGLAGSGDVRALIASADSGSATFRLVAGAEGVDLPVRLAIGGAGAVRAALAAAAMARALGVSWSKIVAGLESAVGPTRSVDEGQPFEVRIDSARTGADLAAALDALRAGCDGRLICVVGAEGGGPGDSRARLGQAAEAGADVVIVTSDNPRDEDPRAIAAEVLAGCRAPARVRVEPDRRLAIEAALAVARPGDLVLIAGKGREAFQIGPDRVAPFDDAEVAARWLRSRAAEAGRL